MAASQLARGQFHGAHGTQTRNWSPL